MSNYNLYMILRCVLTQRAVKEKRLYICVITNLCVNRIRPNAHACDTSKRWGASRMSARKEIIILRVPNLHRRHRFFAFLYRNGKIILK